MLSDKRKQRNRDNLGQALKEARTKAGFTQKALGEALGLEYYTMVSQMELGYMSIPAPLWTNIALTLGLDPCEWSLRCLAEYQPDVFQALFQNRSRIEAARLLSMFHKGQLDDYLSG